MPAFDASKRGTIQQDVTYGEVDAQQQRMDIYYPTAGGPWPVLMFIHGGGWSEGDKAPLPLIPLDSGMLVVSINYRMYPSYRFPAMIEDVKTAIRWLRAHAAECNLDPQRIALIGHSAGGHLAALAGLAGENAGWDGGLWAQFSSQVQAVVDMSGPCDLAGDYPANVRELIMNVFDANQLSGASPTTYARPDAPPFLIVHGESDDIVPVEHARILHRALTAAGASAQLLILSNAGHGFEPLDGEVSPTLEQTLGMVLAFLARVLKISSSPV